MESQSYQNRLVALLFFAWGFVFLDRINITFLFPTIAPKFDLSIADLGQINLWQVVGYAVSAIIFGMISDKTGHRKRWLVVFVFAASLFSALSAAATSIDTLVFFRFLTGMSEGPVLPIAMSMLAVQGNPQKFGRNSGIVNAGVGVLAVTIGPIIVTQLVAHTNWQMAFILSSVPSLILAFFLMKFTKEVEVTGEGFKWKDFMDIMKYRNIVVTLFISILSMGAYWIMLTFAPLYWVKIGNLSNETMGLLASGMGLMGIIWAVVIPGIADRIGRKPTLILFCFISILPMAILYFFQGGWVSGIAYVLLTGAMGGMFPLYMTIIPIETVPRNLAATANALIMGLGELIGGAFIPKIAGSIADLYGLGIVMIFGAIGFLIASIVGLALIETRPANATRTTVVTVE